MRILQHAKYLGSIGLLLLLLIGIFDIYGVQMTQLSRDPLQRLQLPVYLGLLSYLGVLAWCAASAIMLFSAFLVRQSHPDSLPARFLVWMGVLAAILFLDDLFMVHDTIVPVHLHLPEISFYLVYAGYMGLLLVQFWRFILTQTDYILFLLAGVCFGSSVAIDIDLIPGKIGTEDTLKMFGIMIHCYYCILTAAHAVHSVSPPGPR